MYLVISNFLHLQKKKLKRHKYILLESAQKIKSPIRKYLVYNKISKIQKNALMKTLTMTRVQLFIW